MLRNNPRQTSVISTSSPSFSLQACRFGAARTSRCRSRRGCAAAASRSHPARASDTSSGRSHLTRYRTAGMPVFTEDPFNLATLSNAGRGGEDLVQQHPRGRGLDGRVQVSLLRQVGTAKVILFSSGMLQIYYPSTIVIC